MESKYGIIKLKRPREAKRAILLAFYNANFPKSQWDRKKLDAHFSEKNKSICFVIEHEKKIKALVWGRAVEKDPSIITLSSLLVDKEYRSRGFARKLVEAFLTEAFKDPEIKKVELHFRLSNKLGEFYKKLGFSSSSARKKYKDGETKCSMEISRNEMK